MKRTLIGSVTFLSGILITLTILISAAQYVPEIDTWRGSKLWFAIFGAIDMESEQSLFLGVPFTAGLLLIVLGSIILAIEYFKKD